MQQILLLQLLVLFTSPSSGTIYESSVSVSWEHLQRDGDTLTYYLEASINGVHIHKYIKELVEVILLNNWCH